MNFSILTISTNILIMFDAILVISSIFSLIFRLSSSIVLTSSLFCILGLCLRLFCWAGGIKEGRRTVGEGIGVGKGVLRVGVQIGLGIFMLLVPIFLMAVFSLSILMAMAMFLLFWSLSVILDYIF